MLTDEEVNYRKQFNAALRPAREDKRRSSRSSVINRRLATSNSRYLYINSTNPYKIEARGKSGVISAQNAD
jgi:hypothetical protein